MPFTPWYPSDRIEACAPRSAGVYQVRQNELRLYPSGKSAMIHYAQADLLVTSMAKFSRSSGRPTWLYRHRMVPGKEESQRALERLLTRFYRSFGEYPTFDPIG